MWSWNCSLHIYINAHLFVCFYLQFKCCTSFKSSFNLKEKKKKSQWWLQNENTTSGMLNDTSLGIVGTSIASVNILMTVVGILAVVLNGLLLIAMLRYRSTIFTSKGAYLIANLAIADLLTGLNSSRWGLQIAFPLPQAVNKALLSIWWTSIEASFLTILVMSLERYIAIVFPLKAHVWLSKTRTIKSCVAVWFIAALCGASIALSPLIVKFCLTIVLEITILVTTFLYYKILSKLRQERVVLMSMQSTGDRGHAQQQTRNFRGSTSWRRSWSCSWSSSSSPFCRTYLHCRFPSCDACSRSPTMTRN